MRHSSRSECRSRSARFQSTDDLEPTRAAPFERLPRGLELPLHHHRHDNRGPKRGAQAAKARLRHADDGERVAIEANGLTQNVSIAAEPLAPVAIRQHGNRVGAGLSIILRRE